MPGTWIGAENPSYVGPVPMLLMVKRKTQKKLTTPFNTWVRLVIAFNMAGVLERSAPNPNWKAQGFWGQR